MSKSKLYKRISALVVALLTLVLLPAFSIFAASASSPLNNKGTASTGKSITLEQAKALGLKNSATYKSYTSKLALKQVEYTQAVRSLKEKLREKSTFRWSPLLSFKFPSSFTFDESSEAALKPLQLQSEVETIEHQMANDRYTVYENVTNLFVSCYTLQETISFQQNRLSEYNVTLEKNEARLLEGLATQSDIDKINASIKSLETSLSGNMTEFENKKEKLYDAIGLDVRSGYTFQCPYETAEIDFSQLDSIISYALKYDESYYEASVTVNNDLIAIDTNYNLLKNKYGGYINIIKSYIDQVKNNENIDKAAFKLKYEEFLTAIDSRWQGKKRILFFKFPREWLKGDLDGIRYVEDEPYVLYDDSLDYLDAYQEQQSVKKDLEDQIKDAFQNYVSTRKTYQAAKQTTADKKEELEKSEALNLEGKLTYDELSDIQSEYADDQIEEIDALKTYNEALISLDKLSCGAISALLAGESLTTDSSMSGISYVTETEDGAMYYIHSYASDNIFEYGNYIPDDFETDITSYELWINDIQVGERTDIDKTIKHLGLDIDTVDSSYVRFYNGDEFVCQCDIDTTVYSGNLNIVSGYTVDHSGDVKTVGTYSVSTNKTTNMITVKVKSDDDKVKFFGIKNSDGTYLGDKEKVSIDAGFSYLGLASGDLANLTFSLYDEDGNLLYDCQVNTETLELTTTK